MGEDAFRRLGWWQVIEDLGTLERGVCPASRGTGSQRRFVSPAKLCFRGPLAFWNLFLLPALNDKQEGAGP